MAKPKVATGPADKVLTVANLARIYNAPFDEAVTRGGARIVLPAWWPDRAPPAPAI